MKLSKVYKWLCNCFCRGPRPREDLANECDGGGSGTNPMNGIACVEPSLVPGDATYSPPARAQDPPKCHGGDSTLCLPMPVSFRVVFPCPVPGSANCLPGSAGGGGDDPCATTIGPCPCFATEIDVTIGEIYIVDFPRFGGDTVSCVAQNCHFAGQNIYDNTAIQPWRAIVVRGAICDTNYVSVTIEAWIGTGGGLSNMSLARYGSRVDFGQCDGQELSLTIPVSYISNSAFSWPSQATVTGQFSTQ